MVISKKTRALAIEGLDLAASNYVGNPQWEGCTNISLWLDENTDEHELAYAAAANAPGTGLDMLLEAAALLRTGWSPGETVPLL